MAAIPNATLVAGQTLVVTNSATDSDVPAQTLTWSLLNPPSGATINSTNGLLTWRPAIAQSPSTNVLTVQVTDNGTPPLGASRNFQVTVLRPATPSMSLPGYANGTFQVSVTGSLGPDYLIYTKTNLTQPAWSLLLTTNPSVMPFLFTDPTANNFAQRFYRIQLGP
jgi:hypothetical protein